MFSPSVSSPFTHCAGLPSAAATGQYALYCATRRLVATLNLAASSGVHQLLSAPLASYCAPWSSKPWLISWPITAPMPP